MIRGSNAEIRFGVPYHGDFVSDVYVILSQDGNSGPSKSRSLPITKRKWVCLQKEPCVVSVLLAPEETARFRDDRKANAQLFALIKEGEKTLRYASLPQLIPVYPMNGNTVYTDKDATLPDEEELIILDGGGTL